MEKKENEQSLDELLEQLNESQEESNNCQTYPYVHAAYDDSEDDIMMREVYGPPQIMGENYQENNVARTVNNNKVKYCGYCGRPVSGDLRFCGVCGNAIKSVDPEATVQFCLKCGGENLMSSSYCIYCGNQMRGIMPSDESQIPIGDVYASPEVMAKNRFTIPSDKSRIPIGPVYAPPEKMTKNRFTTDEKKEGFFKRLFRRKK